MSSTIYSINGYTFDHDIVLTRSDIPGVQSVDDTPDLQKPISISMQSALDTKQDISERNESNGYAGLDSLGKLSTAVLPIEYMHYVGTWDANGNVPDLSSITVTAGSYYIVSVAGTSLSQTWNVYDIAISDGTSWQRLPFSSLITSVNGKTGNVVLTSQDLGLENVDNTSDSAKPVSVAQQALIDDRTLVPEDGQVYARKNNSWEVINNGVLMSVNNDSSVSSTSTLYIHDKQTTAQINSSSVTLESRHAYDALVYPSGYYSTVKAATDAQCNNILIIESVEEEDVFTISRDVCITLNSGVIWTCKGISVQAQNVVLSSTSLSTIIWKTVTDSAFVAGSTTKVFTRGHVIIDLQQQQGPTTYDLFSNVTNLRVTGVLELLYGDANYVNVQFDRSTVDTLSLTSMSLDGSELYGLLTSSSSDFNRLELRGKFNDMDTLVSLSNCDVKDLHVYDEYVTMTNGYHIQAGGAIRSLHNMNSSNRIYVKVSNDMSIFTNLLNTILDVNGKTNVIVSTSNVYVSNSNSSTVASSNINLQI